MLNRVNLHLAEKHGEKNIQCDSCDYTSAIKRAINSHVFKKHTKCLGFAAMKNLINIDTILVTSPQNQELLDHYKKVVAIAVGRFLGISIPEPKMLRRLLPNHYQHPTIKTYHKQADINDEKLSFSLSTTIKMFRGDSFKFQEFQNHVIICTINKV